MNVLGAQRDPLAAGAPPAARERLAGRQGLVWYLIRSCPLALAVVVVFVVCAIFGPYIVSNSSVVGFDLTARLTGPSLSHLLGTDEYGRDILARVVVSTKTAAIAFLVVVGIAGLIGATLGALVGEMGGLLDLVVSRIIELVQGFPVVLLALGIVTIMGPTEFHALIAIGIGTIPDFFRIARGSAVELRDREFVLAARTVGVRKWRLFYSEMLPNMVGALVVVATFDGAQAILYDATLSFLGLGVQPPAPSFGTMISEAKTYLVVEPMYLVAVGACLAVILLALNRLGDSLSDYFNTDIR